MIVLKEVEKSFINTKKIHDEKHYGETPNCISLVDFCVETTKIPFFRLKLQIEFLVFMRISFIILLNNGYCKTLQKK